MFVKGAITIIIDPVAGGVRPNNWSGDSAANERIARGVACEDTLPCAARKARCAGGTQCRKAFVCLAVTVVVESVSTEFFTRIANNAFGHKNTVITSVHTRPLADANTTGDNGACVILVYASITIVVHLIACDVIIRDGHLGFACIDHLTILTNHLTC